MFFRSLFYFIYFITPNENLQEAKAQIYALFRICFYIKRSESSGARNGAARGSPVCGIYAFS